MKVLTISLMALLLSQITHAHELSDFKEQSPTNVSQWIVKAINKKHGINCKASQLKSGIKGNLRAIYSNDDTCDGGNAFGVVIDITTLKITHLINDSFIEEIK